VHTPHLEHPLPHVLVERSPSPDEVLVHDSNQQRVAVEEAEQRILQTPEETTVMEDESGDITDLAKGGGSD